jgi:gluconate 2-dehydrogenase gamma chain
VSKRKHDVESQAVYNALFFEVKEEAHMQQREASSRRRFLTASMSALGTAWLGTRWPAIMAAHEYAQRVAESGQPAFQFFSAEQAVEVEAMASQIIPTDDTPGAREARVIYFIDRALTTFERDKQPLYQQGLAELSARVRKLLPGENRFSGLTPAQRVQVLTAIEKSEFFETVRVHTIAGFFANPEYGGNHDQIGWKLIGFEDGGAYEPPFGHYDREVNQSK